MKLSFIFKFGWSLEAAGFFSILCDGATERTSCCTSRFCRVKYNFGGSCHIGFGTSKFLFQKCENTCKSWKILSELSWNFFSIQDHFLVLLDWFALLKGIMSEKRVSFRKANVSIIINFAAWKFLECLQIIVEDSVEWLIST